MMPWLGLALNVLVLALSVAVWQAQLDVRVGNSHINGHEQHFSLLEVRRATSPTTNDTAADDAAHSRRRELLARRRVFPQLKPDVCVCVLSYGRLHLLRRTLRAAIEHLERDERDVNYELVWVDNGSPQAELELVRQEFQIEKHVALGANYHIPYGLNTAFFRMCSADYILTLEEDWEWQAIETSLSSSSSLRGAAMSSRSRILNNAMNLLRARDDLTAVILRNETFDQFLKPQSMEKIIVARDAELLFRRYCVDFQTGFLWGAYTNGAALYDRSRLLSVGVQYGEPENDAKFPAVFGEANYAIRVALKYPCSAMIKSFDNCDFIACNGVFEHIGHQSVARDETKRAANDEMQAHWILYDTPLFAAANAQRETQNNN